VSGDLHSPTNAGPDPDPAPAWSVPAAAAPDAEQGHPEAILGAAFAGGLIAALVLRRLGRE
jgi:hypothetical protein